MQRMALDDTSSTELLQVAFKYGDAILVGYETKKWYGNKFMQDSLISKAELEEADSEIWWLLWATTRNLLAHSVIMTPEHRALIRPAIGNVRNLLRLFRIDIASKSLLAEFLNENDIYYYQPPPGKKFWIDMSDPSKVLGQLTKISFETLEACFTTTNQGRFSKWIRAMAGHCIYNLVATRDNEWKREAAIFSQPANLA